MAGFGVLINIRFHNLYLSSGTGRNWSGLTFRFAAFLSLPIPATAQAPTLGTIANKDLSTTITYDFAELIGNFYRHFRSKDLKGTGTFDEKLSRRFGLENHYNHFIIKSCIDLLEDTECAITDFEKFGLNGPTKFDNLGERYLRLYGLLNAVNSQKSILITLFEIFKIPGKQNLINKLSAIKIIDTRHMIASHSVDYKKNNTKDFFRVGMTTVRGKGENISVASKDKSIKVDLVKELQDFRAIFHFELLGLVKHLLTKFFDSKSKFRPEMESYIELIEAKLDGHLIMESKDGHVIIKSK